MIWRTIAGSLILGAIALAGCGQDRAARVDDAGPPLEANPEGPPPMAKPGESGKPSFPVRTSPAK